jgi:polysaccharide biosynthesis/export protein
MNKAFRIYMRQFSSTLCFLFVVFCSAVFGVSVSAQPVIAGKTLAMGPGDQIKIAVFQNPDLTLETRVDGDGKISFPFLNLLDVGGRTPAQVEQLIARGLEQKEVLKRPQVSVSISQYRSQQIAVLGYVNRPGQYVLDMTYTVSGALAQAGGVGAGGADSVVLRRFKDGVSKNIDVDLVQIFRPGASSAADMVVEPGDVLYVHKAPVFYIYGEVQRPGLQRLERDMTVMQALSSGGGLSAKGTEKNLRVTRRNQDNKLLAVDVQLDSLVQPDDVIYVRQSLF